jgi:hypothetical protein
VQPVPEPGDHAEVAAAAAHRPEEVRVMLGVDLEDLAVGGHQLDALDRVDGEPELAAQPADPAAQGDAAHADVRAVAERHDQAVGRGGFGQLAGGDPRLHPGDPRGRVDLDGPHGGQVDQQPALGAAVAGQAVPAAADRDLEAGAGGELQRPGDVPAVDRPDDHRRAEIVEEVVAPSGVVVAGVARAETLPHARLTPR